MPLVAAVRDLSELRYAEALPAATAADIPPNSVAITARYRLSDGAPAQITSQPTDAARETVNSAASRARIDVT